MGSTARLLGMEWLLVLMSSALLIERVSITSTLAQRASIQYSLLLTQSTAMSSVELRVVCHTHSLTHTHSHSCIYTHILYRINMHTHNTHTLFFNMHTYLMSTCTDTHTHSPGSGRCSVTTVSRSCPVVKLALYTTSSI